MDGQTELSMVSSCCCYASCDGGAGDGIGRKRDSGTRVFPVWGGGANNTAIALVSF